MKILVTNDDGVFSEGLKQLAEAACAYGDVVVYAPDEKCSGMSRAITIKGTLRITPVKISDNFIAYSVSGTPTDCVRVAINRMPERPDLILSGINDGYNLGHDIVYSGTVAAAREGAEAGIRSVAFSQPPKSSFQTAERFFPQIMDRLLSEEMSDERLINVNFPDCKADECRGIRWGVRLSTQDLYGDSCICRVLAGGGWELEISSVHSSISEADCDITTVFDNYISVGYLDFAETN